MAARHEWLRQCEQAPEHFHRHVVPDQLDATRDTVGAFLGVEPTRLTFTANATEAFRLLLSRLGPSINRIVSTDLCYGTVGYELEEWMRGGEDRTRAVVPIRSLLLQGDDGQLIDRLAEACTPRSLLVVDQIPSSVPVRLPVAQIIEECTEVAAIAVDGTHAAGALASPVPKAAYWFASFHKWAYSAATSGVLAAPQGSDWSAVAERLRLSTRDHSATFSLPDAFAFPADHLGMSWQELRRLNADVVQRGLRLLEFEGHGTITHDDALPMGLLQTSMQLDDSEPAAMRRLYDMGVEVAAFDNDDGFAFRVSGQPYVSSLDFGRLSDCLRSLSLHQ